MRFLLLSLITLLGTMTASAETVQAFGQTWTVPVAADWAVEEQALHLKVPRPQEKPRRPKQFALAETAPWQTVTLTVEAKSAEGHLILVFAYKDEAHFNYAHLSVDHAAKQPVHNGIFHVYGGDRVRISKETGPAALAAKDVWHQIQLTHDAATGIVGVTVGGKALRALEAVDLSLGPGRIGIGSFFNTASFRNMKISGTPAR